MQLPAVRWQIAILLCLITTVNYLDRQAFAVAGPVLLQEFQLDNIQFGIITSAFLLFYGAGHLVAGPFIDRLGTKRAFSLAVIAWSIAGILHAAGRGFWSFLTYRSLLGLAEAANFPAAVKAVAEWFPREERSLAVGILTVGPGLGAILAPPLLGGIIAVAGWQWAFIVPGLAGFLWLWIWRRWYHDPQDHPRLGEAERRLITAGRDVGGDAPAGSHWREMGRLLAHREVWGLLLSRISNDGAFYFFVAWLPLYLAQARGFDIRQIAAAAWIPFLAADLGALAGGWLGQRLMARGMSLDRSRRTLIWMGALVLAVVSLPAGQADSAWVALGLIGLAMFFIQAKASSLFALPADLFPAARVGTVWGLFGAAGSFGAAAFTVGAGWLSQRYGYQPVFVAVAVTQLLSAVFIAWLVPRIGILESGPAAPGGAAP